MPRADAAAKAPPSASSPIRRADDSPPTHGLNSRAMAITEQHDESEALRTAFSALLLAAPALQAAVLRSCLKALVNSQEPASIAAAPRSQAIESVRPSPSRRRVRAPRRTVADATRSRTQAEWESLRPRMRAAVAREKLSERKMRATLGIDLRCLRRVRGMARRTRRSRKRASERPRRHQRPSTELRVPRRFCAPARVPTG